METFVNEMDRDKFQKTNWIWNKLKLNSKESVGVIVDLIGAKTFKNKEEWVEYYYTHGRTKEQLMEVAKKLHEGVGDEYTLEECFYITEYRVIKESWDGIVNREKKTIHRLQQTFKEIDFRKTEGLFDDKYAVDFEAYLNDELICGIQIKPKSYEYTSSGTKKVNFFKNEEYTKDFGVKVYYILSDLDGNFPTTDEYLEMQNKFFSLILS